MKPRLLLPLCLLLLPLYLLLLPAASCLAGGDTREELRRIMSAPEYGRWRMDEEKAATDSPSLLKRFADWMNRHFGRELQRRAEPSDPRADSDSLRTAGRVFVNLGYVLLGAAALFLLYVVYKIWRERGSRTPPPARAGRVGMAQALEDGDALAYAGDEWNAEADRLANAGELRLAFRSLYLGLLSGLHAKGRIAFSPNRSNWQYVAGFRGEGKEEFAGLTELFDRVWYGRLDAVTPESLLSLRSRAAALLEGEPDGD